MKAGEGKIRDFSPGKSPLGYEKTMAHTFDHNQSASGMNSSMAPHDFHVDESQEQLKLGGAHRSEAPKNYKSEYA